MPANSFDPAATDFTAANALFLARACEQAYLDDMAGITKEMAFSSPCGSFCTVQKGAFGFIAIEQNYRLLVFRGTDRIQGWLTDDSIIQVPSKSYPGLVHLGFSSAVDSVWNQITKLIGSSGPPVWVAGHSLGGAMASLAAGRLVAGGITVQGCYTFGSPRTGNTDYYSAYQPPTWRVVNNNDIVPHVPLEIFLIGLNHFTYKHVGTLKYLDRHGKLDGGMSDWARKKEFILDGLKSQGEPLPQSISDHRIGNYISAIRSNLPP